MPGGKIKDSWNGAGIRDTSWANYFGLGSVREGSLKSHGSYNSAQAQEGRVISHDALGNAYASSTTTQFSSRSQGFPSENQSGAFTFVTWSGFERGTARHSWTEQGYYGGLGPFKRDTTRYDASGNVAFETTRMFWGGDLEGEEMHDRVFYYAVDGKLRAAEWRSYDYPGTPGPGFFQTAFEEYRYDALGRRVLLLAQRFCFRSVNESCGFDWVRRTVWDGAVELYEIQMPLDTAYIERDTATVNLDVPDSYTGGLRVDPNPYYGRVLYTSALGIDQPQSVLRMGYVSRLDTARQYVPSGRFIFDPIPIVPLWDVRGQPDIGMFADKGFDENCKSLFSWQYCSRIIWPGKYFAYERPFGAPFGWYGTLIEDKKDAVGTHYRRNRYYDPKTGRFTQEDPIGLAGGLNLYGFANGDPVNFSDPFGLCPVCIAWVAFEVASGLYDAYETYQAYKRSSSEGAEALHASVLGAIAPGPGNAYRKAAKYLDDFATKSTKNFSAAFRSEREARDLARKKLGRDAVEVEPGKWRSKDGKWQYRAKANDVSDNHVHLEELNPRTGEVLQNWHLRWPNQ